jgi:hypothetical protein
MNRLPSTCAAIRRARAVALDIASEADMDGRPGVARALRRKASAPRRGDWIIEHGARVVTVTISAHGVTAAASRRTTAPPPDERGAERLHRAAAAIVRREAIR